MTEAAVLVLGAGPTGLGAAWRLRELGVGPVVVLDAADRPGGLAASVTDPAGFTWDLGGHVLFSHYPLFDRVMDEALGPDGWLRHRRDARVRLGERWVPYPLQNNLRHLPEAQRAICLDGLRARRPGPSSHFADWLATTFGDGLVDVFLRPYNEKVWATPLDAMGAGWVAERVAVPDLADAERRSAAAEDDVDWGPNARFRFPRRGGTGAIWAAVARGLDVRLGVRVDRVGDRRVWTTAGEFRAEHILSTLPLDALAARLAPADPVVDEAVTHLRRTATHVVGVGVDGPLPAALAGWSWTYFSEPEYPFYRVTVFSNYAPDNVPVPGRQWSLMAEVSDSTWRPAPADPVGAVERGLVRAGLLPAEASVVSRFHRVLPHGYPVPTLGRDDALARIHPRIEARGVWSRGRFGAWRYEVSNQDHAFMQGVEWAEARFAGGAEPTFSS